MPLECDDASVLIDLNAKMERLMLGIDSVKEKQDTMADDITKIKEAVYNPMKGCMLASRTRSLEEELNQTSLDYHHGTCRPLHS
jgi:septation ring formation regulator EzrA